MKLLQSLLKSGMGLEARSLHVAPDYKETSKLKMKAGTDFSARASLASGYTLNNAHFHVTAEASQRVHSEKRRLLNS